MVAPQAKKACSLAIMEHGISERRASELAGTNRAMIRYKPKRINEDDLSQKIRKIAFEKRRFGYRRIHMMLKREGQRVNHKKVFRIYQQLGLKVKKRGTRKRALGIREIRYPVKGINQRWSLDFVSDSLDSGRRIRMLTVIDDFTKVCVGIIVDTSLSGNLKLTSIACIMTVWRKRRICSLQERRLHSKYLSRYKVFFWNNRE